jgi:ribosomal-protein-alanine N-acetyltransferase
MGAQDASAGAVTLRPWDPGDAPAVLDALADPEIHRWTPLAQPRSVGEARAWIMTRIDQAATELHEHFAVDSELGRDLAGGVNLYFAEPRRAEIGYFIGAHARRQGLASSAVRFAAGWAHRHGVERLEALIDVENLASFPVVENAGFRREGLLRSYRALHGVPRDMYIYARLAADPLI